MRKLVLVLGGVSVLGLAVAACEDATTAPGPRTFDGGGVAFDGGGASTVDGQAQGDAGVDAETDAATEDAGDAGDAGAQDVLYAHIDGKLVTVDASTGALTDVGPTGQVWTTFAWDATAKVARVLIDNYTPAGSPTPTPKLGTIDLCTGVITAGPAIAIGANQVRRAEALTQNPATGIFYISVGTNGTGSSTEYLTESNGTVDVATGAVTVLGNHDTVQDDGDSSTFIGSELHLLDVASTNNQGVLYRIDKTSGAATKVTDTGPNLRRVHYDGSRGILFGSYGEGNEPNATKREIVTVNAATGARTSLGPALAAGTYGGKHFSALFSAPKPVCP